MKSFLLLRLSVCLLLCTTALQPAWSQNAEVPVPVPPPAAAVPAFAIPSADNITLFDTLIKQSEAAYRLGHYKEALDGLTQAQAKVRITHSDSYRVLLPDAPQGWTVDDSGTAGSSPFHHYVNSEAIERVYSSNGHKVTITFAIDSPTLQYYATNIDTFSNFNRQSDSSLEMVRDNKAVYREQKQGTTGAVLNHTLTIVAGNVLVTIASPTLGKETLLPFAALINYDVLKKMN